MKDLLVLSTASDADEVRFAYAQGLARMFDAHIDVVLANELPAPSAIGALPLSAGPVPPISNSAEIEAARKTGAELQAALEERLATSGRNVAVLRVDDFASGLGDPIARLARTRDTFICSLPGRERDLELSGAILDRVLVESGRSVIALPHEHQSSQPIRNVTIAWNESREAVRAVAEAMPILQKAEAVIVLLVDQERRAGAHVRPGDDILLHLKRHNVKASMARVAKDNLKTSEAILAEAQSHGTDMLVMGARPDGGLIQWLKGSVTRDVVSKTPLPLFMAH
jgi:nucleotide-binding universal stress UspA family protein